MPRKIILIRHAATGHNIQGLVQGWLDVPLGKKGIKQAKKLSRRLKKEAIDVLYSSDLKRALQTAEEVAKRKGLKLIKTKNLREWNMGNWAGKSWDWVKENFGHIFDESGNVIVRDWKGHGGESINEVAERSRSFLAEIQRKHAGKNVAVVTHGGTKQRILDLLHVAPDETMFSYKNTALTVLKKNKDGSYSAHVVDDASHLEDIV